MSRALSYYLDSIRIFAALGVLMVHVGNPNISNMVLIEDYKGQNFVVIFFVLSGFLIRYSASKKSSFRTYIENRLSKLSSVVIPLLIFTYFIYQLGMLCFDNFQVFEDKNADLKFILNALYLSQSFHLCSLPPINPSFWSLSYEFWYYIIYGVFAFYFGRYKILLISLLCFIAGLKILLLFPIWLIGVAVYDAVVKFRLSKFLSIPLFLLSTIFIILYIFIFDTSSLSIFQRGMPPLFYSATFLGDLLLGIVVGLNIYAFANCQFNFPISNYKDKLIKKLSSSTFPLYLLHFPSLILLANIFPKAKSNWIMLLLLMIIVVLVSIVLDAVFEKFKVYLKHTFTKISF